MTNKCRQNIHEKILTMPSNLWLHKGLPQPVSKCIGVAILMLGLNIHSIMLGWVWSGGAKVLGKLSVPWCPTSLDDSRSRACCACSRCGWGLFGHFFSHLYFPFSFSLSLGNGPNRLKYCLKGPLKPKTTNQPTILLGSNISV